MSPEAGTTEPLGGAEVLVVEDDASSMRLMTELLTEAGYRVRPASDAALALRSARARPPALVLLDIQLPGMDGFQVCRLLKADVNTADVPVIFLSGLHEDHDKGKAFQAGAADYITKPIRKEELLARTGAHLAMARARDDAEQSRRAAQAERDHLQAVLLAAPAAIFVVDETHRVGNVNPAAKLLFGALKPEGKGRSGDIVGCVHRGDDPRGCGFGPSCGACDLNAAILEGLAGSAVQNRALELDVEVAGHTDRRWLIANAEPLSAGRQRSVVMALQDVTALRQGQLERDRLQARLVQSDRLASMGLLAAGVAHEINNPLSYVICNLESLTEDLPKLVSAAKRAPTGAAGLMTGEARTAGLDDGAEALELAAVEDAVSRAAEALAGVRRIGEVARGLGTFARVESADLNNVDVRSALDAAVSMARHEIKYRARVLKAFAEVPAVWASEGKLAQVFLNLLVNAAHAIGEGDVEGNQISLRVWATDEHVNVEVADTGAGIAPENLARVFDPFVSSKSIGTGSGLGLAISRNIISEFGGDIRMESEVGVGTRALVRLPVTKRGVEPQPAERPAKAALAREVPGRILIVDDEPTIRSSMRRLLERAHQVTTAGSGAEAKALLERDAAFDVILCDLMMPDMTGMDLHEWLLGHDAAAASRMVFVTGGAYTPRASEYLARAGNRRLEKPFESAALRSIVAELLLAAPDRA